MKKTPMEGKKEFDLPTLEELQNNYIQIVMDLTPNLSSAARVLGISKRGLSFILARTKILVKPKREKALITQIRENFMEKEMSFSVSAEERDYYYNLDFLRGVYKDLITHALGKGEE